MLLPRGPSACSQVGLPLPIFFVLSFPLPHPHDLLLFEFLVELKVLELKLLEKRGLGLQPKWKFMVVALSLECFLLVYFSLWLSQGRCSFME